MSERLWGILVDSFGKILLPGLTVTIPLTAISFTLALIIAVAVALVQFAHVPVLQRLARFYIWVIRGTPVLVQLFVVFYGLPGVGILIEPFPAAVLVFSINEGAYCAETILWGILVDSFGKILLPGLTVTIPLTAISFTLALIIAVAVALVQFAHVPVLQRLARFYIWVIRGTPVLVQLFVVFYGLPGVGILIEPFPAAVLVFSINEGAYCAETIRAALESVPKGQMEAGQCVGMSYLQVIRRIILPQALRTAFPTLASTLIAMVKDTSLAANITVTEMFMTTQRIVARTYEPLALYIEVGLVYLLFCTVLTRLQAVGERYLNSKGAQRS